MEPVRSYDRQAAFDILKNSAYRGGNVNRLIEGFNKHHEALSMEGNLIKLTLPGKKEIIVKLAKQENNKSFSISRFFKYSIRGSKYKKDYDLKINKILDQLYPESINSEEKISNQRSLAEERYQQAMKILRPEQLISEKKLNKAVDFLKLAAKEGHPEALCKLGDIYYKGRGGKQNVKKAKAYYKKASELGNKEAAQALTNIHLNR